jgi:hypothetical protein
MSDLGGGVLGGGAPDVGSLDRWVPPDQVAAVLGGPPERVELLTHNPLNAVTGGIWRVATAERTVVCKVLTDGRDHEGPAWWAASGDPTHWNWWLREALVYANDLPACFRPDGIDAPVPLLVDERSDGVTVLWLEWVEGTPGPQLGVDGLAGFAEALGRAQARLAEGGPDHTSWTGTPWLTRGFLAGYGDSKPVDEALLDDDRAWAAPRVDHYLGTLRDGLRRLHHQRAELYAWAAACPRTLCHLDVWPANLLRRPDGTFVLVDWAFCGDGALGEDIANLVPDAFFDLLYPVDLLDEVATRVEAAYLAGLRSGGWEGDERWVALGIRSAAVKYHWLIERLLRDPDAPAVVYGGRTVPVDDLYAARATGLGLLCRWADEARALAHDLGVV